MSIETPGSGSANLFLDAHSDILNDVVDRRAKGDRRVMATRHLPQLREGGVDGLVAAVYVEARYKPDRSLPRALHLVEAAHAEAEESPDAVCLCCTPGDLRAAAAEGRIGLLLGLEGAEPLGDSLVGVRLFHRLGIRLVGLTWNQRNQVADGVSESRTGSKLTVYGVSLVRELNRLGVVVDLAHAAESAFYDALSVSDYPVVVSHGNCRAICDQERNLSDQQLESLAEKGGFLGITFHPPLVAETAPSMDGAIRHIEHAARVMGVEHVGIGADFSDFICWDAAEVGEGFAAKPKTAGLESVAGMPLLAERLVARGYKDDEVRGILGENFLRVLGQIVG